MTSRILLDSVYALYPDKTDLRRKEYWWNLGQAITIEGASAPYTPNHAFINKWRDKVYSVNPEITEGSKSKLIAMEGNCIYWRLEFIVACRTNHTCNDTDERVCNLLECQKLRLT